MESPKLCIVTDAWLPQVNGVVTTLVNLVKQAELDGWKVLVIHSGLFKSIPAPGYKEVSLAYPKGMLKMIRDFNPDHLHVATEGPLGLRARIAFRKEVFTTAYHTKWEDIMKDILHIPLWLTKAYLRWFHSNGQVMVTTPSISKYLKKENIASNIKFLSRGVDLDVLRCDDKIVRPDKPVLLSVGRISKEKNLEIFCNLDSKKYDLVIVGDGPIFNELKLKYPHIKFTGVLKGKDLAKAYKSADCMVFTSLKDTFGLVIIESMCMGTPVAAFPVPGPIDIITQETGAIDDNIEIAIQKALLTDREKCAIIAKEKYNWKSVWNQFKNNLVEYEGN